MPYPPHPTAGRDILTSLRARADLYGAAPPSPPPAPPPGLADIPATPQAAEARWANDPALRLEFGGSKDRYLAFCRAAVAGRAVIAGNRAVTGR